MYAVDLYVFIKFFGTYLRTRGDGMRDSPVDRKPLLRGMDLLLWKTIAVPIVLTISNIIIADIEKQKVVYDNIKWPFQIGFVTLIFMLWWRSSFYSYYS